MDKYFELLLFLYQQNVGCSDEDLEDVDDRILEEWLWNVYEINIENFDQLISTLIPLCCESVSPLTNKLHRGFAEGHIWLARDDD